MAEVKYVMVPRGYLDVVQGVLEECQSECIIPFCLREDFDLALAQTKAHLASPPPPVDWEKVGPELVKALEHLRKEPIVAIRQENHRAKIQFTNVSNVLVQESCRQATAIIDAAIALTNPDSPNGN